MTLYAETIASRNTVASHIRALSQMGKPVIDIALNNDDQGAYIRSFTTLDRIEGEVSITAPHDARFDDVWITFEGNNKVWVENMSAHVATANSRVNANHTFLKLKQPIPESAYPVPRIAEAGRTYKFPFTFVVPDRILEHACSHRYAHDQVHEEHLKLPPSLGDPSLASDGAVLLDDMAPSMTRITYAIKVKIVRNRETDGKPIMLAEKTRKLRIIPASEEQPPLDVEEGNANGYVMRKQKDLRKGMFKGKIGRITMEAAQPKSLRLAPPRSAAGTQATTMATVNLRFDPVNEITPPPKLGSLATKLKVHTFFSVRPMDTLPSKEEVVMQATRGVYTDNVPLTTRCVESAKWQARDSRDDPAPDYFRRDSEFSTLSTSTSNSTSSSSSPLPSRTTTIYYTTQILVPITLPKSKTFPPTFHSCLASRVYALDISLNVQAHGSGSLTASTFTLKLPIQISSAGNFSPVIESLQDSALQEVEEFFNPRSIAPPAADLTLTSPSLLQPLPLRPHQPPSFAHSQSSDQAQNQQLPSFMLATAHSQSTAPPPGYSFFAGASQGVPVIRYSRVVHAGIWGWGTAGTYVWV